MHLINCNTEQTCTCFSAGCYNRTRPAKTPNHDPTEEAPSGPIPRTPRAIPYILEGYEPWPTPPPPPIGSWPSHPTSAHTPTNGSVSGHGPSKFTKHEGEHDGPEPARAPHGAEAGGVS
ncbi:hypothetical protein GDO86_016955 [Hymenochirus boettgeri]|uniref:Uncharacterized protein n=1 Tax=Hymenochirus boettgeri TaxID=247094 RepID=A0A8T2IN79_9PIPI|nr:hypothetical protein GDO86_016955 [Hymenochirus boettgeri]